MEIVKNLVSGVYFTICTFFTIQPVFCFLSAPHFYYIKVFYYSAVYYIQVRLYLLVYSSRFTFPPKFYRLCCTCIVNGHPPAASSSHIPTERICISNDNSRAGKAVLQLHHVQMGDKLLNYIHFCME